MLNDGINPENISVISALRNGGVLTEQSADSINIPVGDYQYELSLKSENGLPEKTDLELFFWNAEDKNLIPAANKLFVSSEEMNVILISDYGATPNDGIDDGDAIFSALEAANAAGGKTTVLFDEGEYLLSSGDYSSTTHALSLENFKNIEFQGNNTVLKMKNSFLGVFAFKNCSNISINGIDFDYETLPWAQGKAESINRENGSFIFCTDEETGKILSDERASASIGFGMIMNSENPHILKGNASNYFFIKKYEKTEPKKYRIYLSDDNKNMLENEIALDDNIIINCRKGTKAIFSLNGCSEFSIKNCNVYASCGTDITALNHNGDLNINGLKNIRKNSRWIVTNADGLHIQGIRGKLNVTNSVFDGNSDDCVNIYQKPAYVSEVSSDNKITVYKGTQIPKTGDTVIIANPITGKIKGKSKVVSSEYRQGSSYYVNIGLEDEISEIVSGTDVKNADNIFIEELGGDAVNITNCEFLNSRRYGLPLLLMLNQTIMFMAIS